VVFSVDLFNEGIDVPAVDTLMMLRPTDSPTLFLQQLGAACDAASARRSARFLTSSATIARSFGSIADFALYWAGPRKDLTAQVEGASRSSSWLSHGTGSSRGGYCA